MFFQEDSIPVGENGRLLVALIIGIREEMVTLSRTIKTIQVKLMLPSSKNTMKDKKYGRMQSNPYILLVAYYGIHHYEIFSNHVYD